MNSGWLRPWIAATAVAACSLAAAPAASQVAIEESPRDRWQRVPDVIEALGIGAGSRVADVGAGQGYFAFRLAAAVGATGRVFAVDIAEGAIARLRWTVDRREIGNIETVVSDVHDPHLPYSSLDAILVVNAYHEFEEYEMMLAAFRQGLRPGGRLVLLDNPPGDPTTTRAEQTRRHQLDISIAVRELENTGFEVVRTDPDFIDRRASGQGPSMWLIEARRPLIDPPVQRLRGAPPTADGLFACGFSGSPEALGARPSPPDSVELALPAGGRIKLCYSRPSARDRQIMGGLVPFGEPWRMGANEATVLRIDVPVRVAGVALEPGWYSLYSIPGRDRWEIALNRLVDRPGVPIDDWITEHDVGRGSVLAATTSGHVETMTVTTRVLAPGSGAFDLAWEGTLVRIPVEGIASTGR